MKKIIIPFIISYFLVGCATGKVDKDVKRTQGWSVEKIYNEANDKLNNGNYKLAVKLYDILRSNYPYGKFEQQSYLDTAYAYYLDAEKDKALETLSEFEKKYPNHADHDYVLYLKGLISFNEPNKSLLNKLSAQDWSERDIKANNKTYEIFTQLIQKYPNSKYTKIAQQKIEQLVKTFGEHEIFIARYYIERGAYIAAINRAINVLSEYSNTEFVEEALAIMMTAYATIDQQQLSNDARRVLELNYPQSDFLQKGWYNRNHVAWWKLGKSKPNKVK